MSEAKFTKKMEIGITTDDSPFCIDGFCNVDGERFEVCSVWGVDDDTAACEQSKANAHLIASAPEMYKALEGAARELHILIDEVNDQRASRINSQTETDPDYYDMESVHNIQVLLAKARGES